MRLVLTAILIFLPIFLSAQEHVNEYHLVGIDDNLDYKIRTEEFIAKDIVSFTTKGDVLSIYDVRQIDTVINHLDRFLEVKFVVRGGSGVKNREKALLCVDKGRIFISLLLTSDVESRLTEVYDKVADSLELFDEESQYHVNIDIEERNNRFITTLTETKYVRSKFDPSDNESFSKTYQLNFDKSSYYFFNSTRNLNDKFKLYSHKENKYFDKIISTEAPAIELTNGSYFLIDGVWYEEGRDNILLYR